MATLAGIGKLRHMKARVSLLIFAGLALALVADTRADDYVYLRTTTTSTTFPRYEVLTYRPSFLNDDIIRVPAKDVRGLEQLGTDKRDLPNHYVAPVPFSGSCPRFEVHRLQPGVSYMQSIGGGGGFPLAREIAASRPAALPVARASTPRPQSTSTPAIVSRQAVTAAPSHRPFGWPPYDNPLERRAYR